METDMSDEEHMSYLIKTKKAFEHLAPQVHWFCPANDTTGFDNVIIKTEHSEIWRKDVETVGKNYQDRLKAFADCLEFYAYVGGQAIQVLDFLEKEIERNLERCDQCIVEYYKVKNQWIEQIKATEDDEASAFVTAKLNETDINRITRKLDSLALTLGAQSNTRHPARSCLLDALSCESFLKLDDLVRQHFDRPFSHLRDQALLHIGCHMPGTTAFLFDPDISRRQWALSTWSGYGNLIREDDFNFAIRGYLLKVLRETASMTTSDGDLLERFWVGIAIIIGKLGNNLITHSFRALEAPDVFRIALDQLHYNSRGLRYIVQALSVVLERAPKDYWESMGTISPTTVIENIFNPHFTTILKETWDAGTPKESSINELFAWIRHFVNSLETVHQSQACRAIAAQLMKKLQTVSAPLGARIECWRRGLKVIKLTLMNCNKEKPTFGPTGRVVAAETLEVVSEYIERILAIPTLPEDDPWYEPCVAVSLDVVELALTLECKSLRTDQETLRKSHDIDPGTCSYGPAIWDKLVQQLVHRNVDLARTALNGINGLVGLEKFVTVKDETNRNYKSDYNVKLSHLTHLVCQMLERINDFDQVDLEKLFRKETTAIALVASLFSPDASTYEAGVNLMKTISTQSARQEAIRHVILSYFKTTLDAMSWSMRRIARTRVYASCPRMLTTCKDVLEIFCDSQTGLLRSRALQDLSEVKAVENFWHHQWDVLKVIYEMTDPWSRAHVVNSEVMKEFVRDTMDFSERLFDQYSIFASAIEATTPVKKEDGSDEDETAIAVKRLLDPPARTMAEIVKWLRLRDKYLAGMSVKLTKKVLGRLTEKGMVLAKEPSDFVELVVRGGPQGRTNLEPQEKAELATALETNLGRPMFPTEPESDQSPAPEYSGKQSQHLTGAKKAKNGTINLESWRSKAKRASQLVGIADEDEFGDSDITDADIVSASHAVEKSSKLPLAKLPQRSQAESRKAGSLWTPKPKMKDPAFAEGRKKEIEAKKRRDAEQVAMLRKKTPAQTGGLGIQGKDHAPKPSGVMMSSGSESESGDEIDRDLFGSLAKASHVSDAIRNVQADKLKQLREQGPVKKTRQARSAKDMRARLAPDLTSLHKTILGWEYFNNGDFPPGSGRDDYSLVTNTFRNPIQYQDVFEPLLALEGWQGFLKSREEGSAKVFEIKIANRLTVDSFVEVATTMTLAEGKDLGLSEADVILISKGESPATESQQLHCLARIFKISRKKGTMDVTYRVNVGNTLLPSMTPKATLHGVKILSLTPLEREYGALLGLKYFDLCDEIIKAKPSPILEYSGNQLDSLVSKYKINPAQAKAVRSAIDNDAFTLIQGPPGSGKTKTIVAIVGALLTGQFQDTGTVITRPQSTGSNVSRSSGPNAAKKLLVCAPSNAAVDELVMRCKDGVKSLDGAFHKPSVVRLGRSDAINAKVVDVTLEELVNAKINATSGIRSSSSEDIHQIMMAHKSACDDFNTLRATTDALRASGKATTPEQERELEILKRKRQQLSNKIDAARDSGDTVARDAEITRRKIQQEILDGAHILCATLSGSGHEMFQGLNIEFETVVIDEAAQSIELSALIPLKYGCSKCILVGDPKQLPPTVLSREAARFQYEQSLFVRMQINHPEDVHLLDTQYRMHPEISMFPSKEFYDGRLLDGEGMAQLRARPWHQSGILGPYRFFDVQGTQQSSIRGHSLINIAEIDMALKLFGRLITDCRGYEFTGKVGIITPYKSQLRELRSRFAQTYGDIIFSTIEFNTTDAFQGRESEVIIFSCVRASVGRGIGFVSDIRRMNVGITRAKSSLWVLGNSQSLMQGEYWAKLILDAKSRGRYSGSEALDLLQTPLVKFDSINAPESRKFSITPRDIEMIDAPAPGNADAPPQPVDSAGTSGSHSKARSDKPSEYIVSGGYNGLNTTRSCATCGSTAHYSHMCDNNAAKVSSRGGCHRCGDLNHEQNLCLAERCLECGKFGHTRRVCTSAVALSRSERDKIQSSEASHKRRLDRLPEIKRKRQLGDHDKSVPVILPTLDAPMSTGSKKKPQQQVQQGGKKRPREPSPPVDAPKGPKTANGGSVRIQDAPRNIPTGPAATLSLRPPTLPSAHKSDSFSSTQTNNTRKLSSDSISPYPTSTKFIESSAANSKLNAILREGTGESEETPSSAYTPGPRRGSMANVKPPVKKKKDANLFIIPNKKRK